MEWENTEKAYSCKLLGVSLIKNQDFLYFCMPVSNNKTLLGAYAHKILGIRNYKSMKKEFFVNDFLELQKLEDFLEEVSTGESDITPAGKLFLEKYYGLEKLSTSLVRRGKFTLYSRPSTFEEFHVWLEELQPMATISFIEKAKGNFRNVATLRSDLLPPDNI